MSGQRQKPIDFAAEGLRLALFVDRNCGIRVYSCPGLLTNFWAIVLGKIKIAIGAMKIHAGPEHVRIDHKDFLARRTRNLDRLTHFSSWRFFRLRF
jgi:hypothetical protein